jgi:NAD(P)-dependent dehydrogenase (short-subunit alcohol dehydrogenase family)
MKNSQTVTYKTAAGAVADLDLSTQTILITGCNSGLGFETMRVLASRGAFVVALARTRSSAQESLVKAGARGLAVECDLSDLKSVATAIKTILSMNRKLDALVASAGIVGTKTLVKKYGVEMQFLVNYLSHFALVNGLSRAIKDHTGRVVIVSSDASEKQAPKEGIRFNDLGGDQTYSPFVFYGQSKLACSLYAKELARRLASRGIVVNSLHPGAVRGTGLNKNLGFPLTILLKLASFFMKTIEEGATTQTYLAANPAAATVTGQYLKNCRVAGGSRFLSDDAIALQLWALSEELVQAVLGSESANGCNSPSPAVGLR